MRKWRLLVVLSLLVLALPLGWIAIVRRTGTLPDLNEVTAMHLWAYGDLQNRGDRECDISPEHFASILDALHPYRPADEAIPWVYLGWLQITVHGGYRYEIALFSTKYGEDGAFTVWS